MNKIKIELEKRKGLNLLRYSGKSGSLINRFYYYESEKDDHIDKKYQAYRRLRSLGYDVLCEAIFNTGGRPDILAFRNGEWKIVEILSSEKEEKLLEKVQKYPDWIEVIKIKDYGDIGSLQ